MFTMVEHVHTTKKKRIKRRLVLAWDNVGWDSMAHYDTIIRYNTKTLNCPPCPQSPFGRQAVHGSTAAKCHTVKINMVYKGLRLVFLLQHM